MKKETKKAPTIRFRGFNEEWEQRKLEDFGRATGGTSIESEFNKEGKYKVISIGSYSENSTYTDQGIRCNLTEKTQNRILNKNDLTMILNDKTAVGRIIGRVLLIEQDNSYVYNQRTERIEPNKNKYDPLFLYEMLNAPGIRSKIVRQCQGNTQIYVNWPVIANQKYKIPELKEQKIIGFFLKDFDHLITLHQRKLDQLKTLKKYFLQNMFPAKGEKVPRIRFKGFTGDWEQRKVSDIAGRYDNLRVPVSSNKRVHGTTPYYGANGVQDYVDGYTHDGEYILIAEDGANDLQNYPVHYVNGRIWVNNHAHVLQGKTGIADTKFLSYAFSQIDISSLLVGGGRAKLNADVLMKLDLLLPEHKEQEKLGNYFSHIDSLIALHQHKLDQLQTMKKFMLQNMFI